MELKSVGLTTGVANPAPGGLLPNTTEPANQGVQDYSVCMMVALHEQDLLPRLGANLLVYPWLSTFGSKSLVEPPRAYPNVPKDLPAVHILDVSLM